MRSIRNICIVLQLILVVTISPCLNAEQDLPKQESKYLDDWAKSRGHTEVAEMQITALELAAMTSKESGESPEIIDANQPTRLLFAAIKAGDIDKARVHIANGADVDSKDTSGRMPIHYTIVNKQKEIARLLTATAVQPDTFEGRELTKVRRLLSHGMNIDAKGNGDNTLLHYAAQAGYVYVAAYLIGQGADINTKNRSGQTPTQVAMQKHFNQPTTALLLLDAGAIVTDLDKGIIALKAAKNDCEYGSKGAEYEDGDETAQSPHGSSPKHDIAITNTSVADTYIQGNVIPVTVTIENRGRHRESFRAVLLDGATLIAGQSVTLAASLRGGLQNTADIVFAPETLTRTSLGNRVCIGGDINGDGFADMMVGANRWQNDRGRAYLYFGGANMDAFVDVILSGNDEGDGFANNQGSAFGDVNGDGYDDVIIGARPMPWYVRNGYVSIYYGGPDMDDLPDVVLRSLETGPEGRFGTVVAGDVDNDGYCDVLVGATHREHAYLFWGGDPMSTKTPIVFQGKNTGNYFGHRMAIGGDVNGDGYKDLIIGARQGGKDRQGQAYLYFGNSKKKMDTKCDWLFTGETSGDHLGSAVDIFDIDNDGYDDVIIAARYAPDNWRGRVYIYWGARDFDGNEPGVIFESKEISTMGEYLQCGYVNNDQYGDILVGGWQYPGPPYKHGRAYLFYGNAKASIDTNCDHIFEGEGCTEDYFGFHVSVGDVNSDGFTDALVGAPGANHSVGRAYLYYGPFHDTTDITFTWDTTNASIGKHILKVEIPSVPGEQNIEDNIKTLTIEVKELRR